MTELVFILDRSGSMNGLEKDTIGGFNAMIEKQKREAGETLVSTVLFDSTCEVIHDRLPLDKVPAMTEEEYDTRGCTALLEAVCSIRASRPLSAGWKKRIEEDRKKRRWSPPGNFGRTASF